MTQPAARRALIVDDDARNLYMLRALLQGHGWAVDEARDGAEALARAQQGLPQLVVSDLLMPVMDGYTLLRRWKQDARLRRIPFIVYTATYTDPKDERLALALGADAFVLKPAEPDAFMARVAEVLEAAESRSEAPPPPPPADVVALLADYNETLLRKLEKRSLQLEQANAELRAQIARARRSEEEVRPLNAGLEARVAERTAELSAARVLAESASVAKSSFLANMSHEIRTPLNAILGLTHLVARDSAEALQRERLGRIEGAARHLLQLINDILDLSKIEAGKMSLREAEFALDPLLAQAFEMVATAAQDKGLELVLDAERVPERLRGDAMRLSQALINLLSNAVKFTDRGWVRLRLQLLSEAPGRVQLRFEVQDTGPGIDAERQARLFSPFEQGDASAARPHTGTGLGLALTRRLARLMDGDAGVHSVPGEGSRVWFTAWLGRGSVAEDGPRRRAIEGLRALVIDDLPESCAALGVLLGAAGLVVDARPSGSGGLQALHAALAAGRPYDVMLVDAGMPELDGVATLCRARAELGPRAPACILVSAFDRQSVRQQAREAGIEALLVKPVTASALVDALMQVLRHGLAGQARTSADGGGAAGRLQALHAGRRVLLVEDNEVNREVAGELLGSVGLVVESADNGHDACTLALERAYDLILMDVQMPGMDGLDATREIRRHGRGRVPIVAMTANAFEEDRQACLDAGMDDYVAKPVEPEDLYATLLRWMPRR